MATMNVLGHNIANVNTIGFKSQRMDFQDMFYNTTYTASGPDQIGLGARVGVVLTDFSQGSFEQTGLSTDLAIAGKGYFQVRVPGQDTVYYTRAGDFIFDKDGNLTSPQGYILQGWQVPLTSGPIVATAATPQKPAQASPILGTGIPVDIKLETWTVLPKETDRITQYVNLSADSSDHSTWDTNPFAALFNTWDGQLFDPVTGNALDRIENPYLAEDAFAYQTSIKIYDDAGIAHTATVYFDKVDKNWSDLSNTSGKVYYDDGKPSETIWEYIVTIDPAEDNRMYWDVLNAKEQSIQTTAMAGILMTGTMTFGSNGDLIDLSSYTLMGGMKALSDQKNASGNYDILPNYYAIYTDPQTGAKQGFTAGAPPAGLPPEYVKNTVFYPIINNNTTSAFVMDNWYPTAVSNNGYPLMVANFTAVPQAHTIGSPYGEQHLIEMDFGITVSNLLKPWDNYNALSWMNAAAPTPGTPSSWVKAGDLAGIAGTAVISPEHCMVTGAASSSTTLSRQNGYTYGSLMDIYFSQNGVMNGIYSNGVTLPLYQIVLYDFVAPQYLRFEGGNLISQTMDSGDPSWGAAGVNGFGAINGYMIEQSNVDLAKEMVYMITTQRGYQANSKVITSVDTMIDTVINMKR